MALVHELFDTPSYTAIYSKRYEDRHKSKIITDIEHLRKKNILQSTAGDLKTGKQPKWCRNSNKKFRSSFLTDIKMISDTAPAVVDIAIDIETVFNVEYVQQIT